MARRPSSQTAAVLHELAEEPQRWRYGYELGRALGLKAGSLYPILMRLHERGLLESSWEARSPGGRPPRHLYRLTGDGLRAAATLRSTSAGSPTRRPVAGPHPRPVPGGAS